MSQWKNWYNFLQRLSVVVLDESHTYCGTLGGHVANLLRRLYSIVDQANPNAGLSGKIQFFLSSATVANAKEMGLKLMRYIFYESSSLIILH